MIEFIVSVMAACVLSMIMVWTVKTATENNEYQRVCEARGGFAIAGLGGGRGCVKELR